MSVLILICTQFPAWNIITGCRDWHSKNWA